MKKKNIFMRVLATGLILAVGLWFFLAIGNLNYSELGRAQLEEAVRRSAVACFAAEGRYPPSLDYLKEHYGLQIDERRYVVFYEVYAENLMPDIVVLEKSV